MCRWVQELLGYHDSIMYRCARMMRDVNAISRRFGPSIALYIPTRNNPRDNTKEVEDTTITAATTKSLYDVHRAKENSDANAKCYPKLPWINHKRTNQKKIVLLIIYNMCKYTSERFAYGSTEAPLKR